MSQTMILNDPIVAHCYHAQANKCITSFIPFKQRILSYIAINQLSGTANL